MASVTSFATRVLTRSFVEREPAAPVRAYTGGDIAVTLAPASATLGWKKRLPEVLPGCTAELVACGHRRGDLVRINTPEGEHVELAQTYTRPTESLVRHPSPVQVRVINALTRIGLVLAHF